jgi:hypothetical protein
VYGSNVIFAGDTGLNNNAIDIYNTEDGTTTSLPHQIRHTTFKSFIVGSVAYLYAPGVTTGATLTLDLSNNTIIQHYYANLRITSAATNGTHMFILSVYASVSSIYVAKVGDWRNLTYLQHLRLPPYQEIFAVNYELVLLDKDQIAKLSLPDFTFTALPSLVMNMEGALQVGTDIYVLAPEHLTVVSQTYGVTQYAIGQSFFWNVQSAVEHNGRLYFSGQQASESVLTVDTNALFQRINNHGDRHDMALNGFYFPSREEIVRLHAIKLSTEQTWTRDLGQIISFRIERNSANNRLVMLFGQDRVYEMFDTVTEIWTSGSIDFQDNGASASVSLHDLAVFKSRDYSYLFNTSSLEWVRLTTPQTAVTVVGNTLAFIPEQTRAPFPENIIQLYNVFTRRWMNVTVPLLHEVHSTVAHGDILFVAGGRRRNEDKDDVISVNVNDGSVIHEHLSFPRRAIRTLAVKDFVLFAGGQQTTLVPVIDVYNVVTGQWRTFRFIQSGVGGFDLVPFQDTVFIMHAHGVEQLNLTSGVIQLMPIPFTAPVRAVSSVPGMAVGSKVLFFGQQGSNSLTITLYETSTRLSSTYAISSPPHHLLPLLLTTQNYIIAVMAYSPRVLQFATMENTLHDVQLFYGDSTAFEVSSRGANLTSQWHRNNVPIIGETQTTLTLNNVTQQAEGDYSIKILDQCNQLMTQRASLVVHGPPVITRDLEESIVMCHEKSTVTTSVTGVQVTLNWTIGETRIPTTTAEAREIVVNGALFSCGTSHRMCVTAVNPAGTTTQCATVRIVDHDSVFAGPSQLSSQPLLIRKTDVDLVVSLVDDECDEHVWLVNGVKSNVTGGRTSTMRVHLDSDTIATSFSVQARCGSSVLTSHAFKFTNVSSLDVGGVVAVVLVCFFAVVGALVIAVVVRRRMATRRQNEVELANLLNQAKAETFNRDGVPILKSTTWEWSPTEEFTFKPLDKMSFTLDSSSLAAFAKQEPVKVGVWNQNIISFTLRGNNSTKNKRGAHVLKERLIGGTHVDIYAPKSPKYEIKVEPSSFSIADSDTPVHVTVSSLMRITSKCKVGLIVVCEHEQVYSICEFKLTSGMATWIDLDEIEMTGDYLGGGGFGSVTRGIYRGQDVAVKKLLSQYLTPEMQIEFEREIMLMKDLHHPNIVQLIGASNIKGNLAIVIEFAPLGSLASVMEKHSLSLIMKITMLLESAKALQFLHANGIIHRDIKPQNILVFSLEQKSPVHVKLTDFGTARMISEEAMTVTKNIGTISFMAPESLGKNPRIEKSADVYSFALLMWSVLLEQTPFSELKWDSDVEAHVKAGHRLPFPPSHGIDAALMLLISECWAHEPHERPSMANVVQRLVNLSSSLK